MKKIKAGVFSRGFSLARVTATAGAKVASHAVGSLFAAEEERGDRIKALLSSQLELLARELGQLKGSLMKVGQMLSVYGEHFLPPEANAVLKTLQSQSPPLDWGAIENVLKKQLGPEKLALLEIDPIPIASASLGQVHRARLKRDGGQLALKIQYPGVDRAIEGDLRALRSILSLAKVLPKGPRYDGLFKEVRMMLHQEVDYVRELASTGEFREVLEADTRFTVPETFPEFSSRRVLATSYEEGIPIDDPRVLALPQDRRNALGLAFLDLYFRELFGMRAMQTDPHFGNYRVRLGQGGEPDRLVLLDFGAVRKFPKSFLDPYTEMVKGALLRDRERIFSSAGEMGFFLPSDSPAMIDQFCELCYMIAEPFHADGDYDWGQSDLPKRVARKGAELAISFRLRPPPGEVVFLDRKMGGVFIFLSVLKTKIRAREVLEKWL